MKIELLEHDCNTFVCFPIKHFSLLDLRLSLTLNLILSVKNCIWSKLVKKARESLKQNLQHFKLWNLKLLHVRFISSISIYSCAKILSVCQSQSIIMFVRICFILSCYNWDMVLYITKALCGECDTLQMSIKYDCMHFYFYYNWIWDISQ